MTKRRVIYPSEFFDREDTPIMDFVNLNDCLPADTITTQADGISFAFTLAADGSQALVPQLLIRSPEMGVYRFMFDREVLVDLANQVIALTTRTAEEFNEMTNNLIAAYEQDPE